MMDIPKIEIPVGERASVLIVDDTPAKLVALTIVTASSGEQALRQPWRLKACTTGSELYFYATLAELIPPSTPPVDGLVDSIVQGKGPFTLCFTLKHYQRDFSIFAKLSWF